MTVKKTVLVIGVIGILLVLGYSCGGTKSESGSSVVKHIAVDPYIVGAKFFEDLNDDGIQNLGEQLSSLTDANGLFTFSSPLSTGATVVLSNTVIGPLHNGISYTAMVKRKVDATGTLVCSPLTTLLANGWTEDEVVLVLSNAGLTGITTADLKLNPMSGVDNLITVTEAALVKIRASIAVYSFMTVMDTLIAGQGYDITYSIFNANAITTTPAMQKMVESINYCLSSTLLGTIQGDMSGAPLGMPVVTVGDVIKSAVAMANWIIPQVATQVGGPAAFVPNNGLYATMSYRLGLNFYIIRNKTNLYVNDITGALSSGAPSNPLKTYALSGILTRDTIIADEFAP
ncbi:MAG TPA: hypothetical protein VJC37_09200 [Planctomycetota bacterium]|nr:hypothetical protein [Planctomycetota bacterium]